MHGVSRMKCQSILIRRVAIGVLSARKRAPGVDVMLSASIFLNFAFLTFTLVLITH